MKKLIYTGAFALLAIGFVACSSGEAELDDAMDEVEMTEEAVSEETKDELDETLENQEEAEQLEEELSEFIETL